MASRFIARRLSAFGKAASELNVGCRGYATAAVKFHDENNVDVKSKATQAAATRPRPPIGIFSEMFPPLGRGTSLLNMMDTMEDLFSLPSAVATRPSRSSTRTPWDVIEDEKAFKLRLDMPGLSKEEVKVDVEEGHLLIKGEHKGDAEDDWSSRSTGSYNIKIKLPDNIKADAIKAEIKNGVLRVTAPKVEESKKRVEVRVD
eukprot:c6267_g1_i1 orf=188-793(+)